jgi:DNA-binding CsgD family transcriptional regulator
MVTDDGRIVTREAEEQLSFVIAGLYDAALESELWPKALELVCAYVGGISGMIFWQDAASRTGNRLCSFNDNPEYTRLYLEKYVKLNPLIEIQHSLPVGEVRAISDTVPFESFLSSRFHLEWSGPQGYGDVVAVNLEKSATSYIAATVIRHINDSPADAEAFRRMQLLVPHIRRAALIAKIIEGKDERASSFSETLDGLHAGVFLLDTSRRLVHANKAAKRLLASGNLVTVSRGLLQIRDKSAAAVLLEACQSISRGGFGNEAIGLSLKSANGEAYTATALPLAGTMSRRAALPESAAIAVFIQRASLASAAPIALLGETYGLTKAELRILEAIVENPSVPSAAAALGLSDRTVKTHLHSLFVKTGAHNQAELIKLVAVHSTPAGN